MASSLIEMEEKIDGPLDTIPSNPGPESSDSRKRVLLDQLGMPASNLFKKRRNPIDNPATTVLPVASKEEETEECVVDESVVDYEAGILQTKCVGFYREYPNEGAPKNSKLSRDCWCFVRRGDKPNVFYAHAPRSFIIEPHSTVRVDLGFSIRVSRDHQVIVGLDLGPHDGVKPEVEEAIDLNDVKHHQGPVYALQIVDYYNGELTIIFDDSSLPQPRQPMFIAIRNYSNKAVAISREVPLVKLVIHHENTGKCVKAGQTEKN